MTKEIKNIIKKTLITICVIQACIVCTSFAQSQTNVNFVQHEDATTPDLQTTKADTHDDGQDTSDFAKASSDKQDEREKADIYLNFENASLASVVEYLAEQKKINVIPAPNLGLDKKQVSLTTRKPLTLTRAWNVLLTLLELNGVTIINVDGIYRIVQAANNGQEPLPIYSSATGTALEDLPDTDQIIRYLYFLENISVDSIKGIIQTVLNKASVQANKDLDALIITEKSMNIKNVLKIIRELDQGGLRESLKIVPLQHVTSDYVAGDKDGLFAKIIPKDKNAKALRFLRPQQTDTSSFFSTDTQIISYPAKNSIILMGTATNINRITDFIQKYIDVPLDNVVSRIHIKDLKYISAKTISPIINSIIKPFTGTKKGSYPFFEDAGCTPDAAAEKPTVAGEKVTEITYGGGNRLIFSCNKDDWKRLEKLVDQLDKPQPQVAFEVLIIDVAINQDTALGAEVMPKNQPLGKTMLGKGVKARFKSLYATGAEMGLPSSDENYNTINTASRTTNFQTAYPGSMEGPIKILGTSGATLSVGQKGNIWGVAQAYLNKGNFHIISQPFLVTNNNKQCTMDISYSRFTDGALSKSVGVEVSNVKDKVTAKTKVDLTPKVNTQGLISLNIHIESEAFSSDTTTNADKTARILDTQIQMMAGEVLVLGGLTKSSELISEYKIPVLGDIPILGNLFRSKSRTNAKTNLYIFIRPSIIKPRMEGFPDEYTRMKLDYAKYKVIEADTYAKEHDPIQRWFFRPHSQSIKERLKDSKKGVYRPIDNFSSGFSRPKSVNIKHDPYYRGSEVIAAQRKKAKKLKRRQKLGLAI